MPVFITIPASISPFLIAFAVVVGFFTLQFVVALRERRLTVPYVVLSEEGAPGLPDYVRQRGEEIMQHGFRNREILAHAKKPMIQILATVWFSPDRIILVLTGSGTVLKIPTQQTWLYTPLEDGRWLVTTDRNDEGDPTGMYRVRRRLNAPFPELLALHEKRMTRDRQQVRSFAEDSASDALLNLYAERAVMLVEQRRARWLDSEHRYWRYTWRGALRVCTGFFPQLFGALGQFWRVVRP